MALLTAEKLNKTFRGGDREFKALDDVCLTVGEGECVALIGESGSGKTTVARVIAGLTAPDSGVLTYDGFTLTDAKCRPSARNSMQMVFQDPYGSFSPRMRLGAGIREGLVYLTRLSAAEQEKQVDAAMERVGLPLSYKRKYVFEVSGGESQRAAIARAILSGPKLLICDEITSALDASIHEQIIALLGELQKELNMALLFISHDIRLVRNFSDRVYVMQGGRIVEVGETAKLFEDPQEPYTKNLIRSAWLIGE